MSFGSSRRRPAPGVAVLPVAAYPRRRWLMATSALLLSGALAGCQPETGSSAAKPSFHASDISGSQLGETWTLADPSGQPRTLADFRGKVVAVFFGFTQCPDVCPTTLAELVAVRDALGPLGEQFQPVLISVDPERDTPEVLSAYVGAFDPAVVALRGEPEALAAAARSFKAFYAKVPTESGYTMDHSAGLYLFDPQGRIRLYARYGQPVETLVADVRQLLEPGQASR